MCTMSKMHIFCEWDCNLVCPPSDLPFTHTTWMCMLCEILYCPVHMYCLISFNGNENHNFYFSLAIPCSQILTCREKLLPHSVLPFFFLLIKRRLSSMLPCVADHHVNSNTKSMQDLPNIWIGKICDVLIRKWVLIAWVNVLSSVEPQTNGIMSTSVTINWLDIWISNGNYPMNLELSSMLPTSWFRNSQC